MTVSLLLYQFITGFVLGLPASLHCIGMCGSIMATLGASAPPGTKARMSRFATNAGTINLGRITTYTLAGAIAGGIGLGAVSMMQQQAGFFLLRALAGTVLMFLGMSLLGFGAFTELLNKIMAPVSAPLGRLGATFGGLNGLHGAFLKGAVWGFLPCGMVYGALIYAALSGTPQKGAAIMAGFGMATVPALIAAAFSAHLLTRPTLRIWASRGAGIFIIIFAVATFVGIDAKTGDIICSPPPS